MDITKLWNPIYLFGPNPLNLSRSDHIFFWAAVALLGLGIIAKILVVLQPADSPRRRLFGRGYHLGLTIGLLILFWAGARYENIPWLSTHFLVLLLWFLGLVWFVFIMIFFLGTYRAQYRQWQDETVKRKYLNR